MSWPNVFREENVINFLSFDKEVKIPIGGRELKFNVKKALTTSLITLNVISFSLIVFDRMKEPSSILTAVSTFYFILVILLSVVEVMVKKYEPGSIIYNKVSEIDRRLGSSSKEELDLFSSGLLMLFAITIVFNYTLINMVFGNHTFLRFTIDVTVTICSFSLIEVSIMKYQIAKRLRMVISEEEPVDQVEQLMDNTRELLEYNTQLNTDCEPLVTATFIYFFYHFITFLYNMWIVQGTGYNLRDVYEHYPIISVLWNFGLFVLMFSVVYMSSVVVKLVDNIRIELDISLTGRPCSDQMMEKISMYLLELAHTPVVISGLGLFYITCSSLITAFGLLVTYLLVLIQFS